MRRPQIIKLTKETIHVISAKMDPNNDIDSEEVDYMISNDFRTANNFSRVRIPSAFFVSDKVEDSVQYSNLFKSHRKQVGTHLFVGSDGKLFVFKAHLDQNHKYHISVPKLINEVYPCFTKDGDKSHLCLGLRFSRNLNEGVRSFGRIADNQSRSGGVFDILEDFLDPKLIKVGINSMKNRIIFPRDQTIYAIYLCSGAKLIVEDDRYDQTLEKSKTEVGVHSNRCLFQSGSQRFSRRRLQNRSKPGDSRQVCGENDSMRCTHSSRVWQTSGRTEGQLYVSVRNSRLWYPCVGQSRCRFGSRRFY